MQLSLEEKISRISKVFDIKKVLSQPSSIEHIARYYRINRVPYSLFHTRTDLIYMGISRDGVYKEDDLLAAARTVSTYIIDKKAENILELATGRGANSFWLAKQYPNSTFRGLDISEGQLMYARRKARLVTNFYPEKGDYHDLKRYPDNSFDVVFEVEALCYSTNKRRVLEEVKRVLKSDGVFILFDGYRNRLDLNSIETLAIELVEKGMALAKFEHYQDFRKTALDVGFSVKSEEDLSSYVLPTMRRFERAAHKFFSFPLLARLVKQILPKEFLYNAISGYLMPDIMERKIAVYMSTILV